MTSTGLNTFDTTIEETNELLHEIELTLSWEVGWEGRRREAYDALRAVLQTLRDRMTIEETAHFSAQLPMLVRGIFYEGWDPTHMPIKMDKEAFLKKIVERGNFPEDTEVEKVVRVIMQAIKSFVNAGEIEDVKGILPKEIASLI